MRVGDTAFATSADGAPGGAVETMNVTGTSIGLFTKLGFDISRTIHFYEAILATLAILVWHFYFVIFNPDVYPMNLSWLTGRLSEEEMTSEHPRELEQLRRGEEQQAEGGSPTESSSR